LLRKAGDPTAIPELARIYQEEDDPVVREAASDALRFFAKQEKSGGGGSSALRNVSVLLVISLVALVALNVVTRMGSASDDTDEADVTATPTAATVPTDRDILMTNYTLRLFEALDDINAMRTDWANGAGALTCEVTLKRPQPFIVQEIDRQTYPDITFVDDYNQALTDLQTVTAEYDAACASPELGTEEQRTAAEASLTSIESQLTIVADAMSTASESPVATIAPPTPVPTATFDVTLTPSPTATVTLVPTLNPEVSTVVRELDRRISNTETELNSLINNKWLIVQAGGVSQFGCTGASFADPYDGASEQVLTDEPDLEAIIVVLNEALIAAQASADLYATNCTNGTLNATIIDQGLGQAVTALSNIELAKSELERLYPQ
jgi:hypothetical protein